MNGITSWEALYRLLCDSGRNPIVVHGARSPPYGLGNGLVACHHRRLCEALYGLIHASPYHGVGDSGRPQNGWLAALNPVWRLWISWG